MQKWQGLDEATVFIGALTMVTGNAESITALCFLLFREQNELACYVFKIVEYGIIF